VNGVSTGLVSIIINNYNYGRYLAEAIDSALRQTGTPVEVIVVDDGSSDHSREVLATFGERVRAVCKPNGGQASALNAGFALSRGAIVIFLDADYLLLPGAAQAAADALRANPEAARAHYRMEVIDAAGRGTGVLKPYPHLPLLSGDLRRQVLRFPDDLPWLPTSGNAFAARALQGILPMPEAEFRILADYYLNQLSSLFGPVVAIDRVLASYRVHGGNQYEQAAAALDLNQVRRTIVHWQAAHVYLQRCAEALRLAEAPKTANDILSVAFVANRLVSLKFAPAQHPLRGDTVGGLVVLGLRAASRRFDVRWPIKLMFMAWFLALWLAPAALAWPLAEAFFAPERRRPLNAWLRRWHKVAPA